MVDQNQRPRLVTALENVIILPANWRNFSGAKRQYNAEGSRNFNIRLDEEIAHILLQQGWNVKPMKPREEDGELIEQGYYLKINVNFSYKPPAIYVISSGGKVLWGESLIGQLDELQLEPADIKIVGKPHDMNGGGYTAYLSKMYVPLVEDDLDRKWAHVQQIPSGGDGPPSDRVEYADADPAY